MWSALYIGVKHQRVSNSMKLPRFIQRIRNVAKMYKNFCAIQSRLICEKFFCTSYKESQKMKVIQVEFNNTERIQLVEYSRN